MIIIRIWGGIGNQLFQYYFGQFLRTKTDHEVQYDCESFGNSDTLRKLELKSVFSEIELYDGGKNFFSRFRGIRNRIIRYLWQIKPNHFFIQETNLNIEKMRRSPKGVFYCQGYWQDEKYIKALENQYKINTTPEIPIDERLQSIANQIKNDDSAVCLHVRRGDYFAPKNIGIYGVCTPEYYEEAKSLVEKKISNAHYYIFTDDIDWVKDNINLENAKIIPNFNIPQYTYIYLMSLCKHCITSNSSFSWWGAYGIKNPNKLIVSPSPWFRGQSFTLAMDKWIQIKCK